MRRYWVENSRIQDDTVHFDGDLFHHIFDVCRQDVGSKFEVLTEDAKAYFVEVTTRTKKNAQAKVLESRIIPPLPLPHVHIALSLSRFPVMDAVLEKAVELGIKSIQPLFSDFSFLRSGEKLSENKTERWEKIVRSATQQSGRGEFMKIHPVQPLENFLTDFKAMPATAGVFAYEGESTLGIKECLQKLRGQSLGGLQNIWLFIGSEGGFSYQEVELMTRFGLEPVTIGRQVLRVETACIAVASAIKYEFDLMK
ncbi:MAG: RsmE family RNA methyltransferase [Bdellovibrionia bacterium]